MNKQHVTLIALFSMVAFTVMSFTPAIYTFEYWKAETPGRGAYKQLWGVNVSILGSVRILAILTVAFAVITTVVLIMHLIDKKVILTISGKPTDVLKYAIYSPMATALLFFLHFLFTTLKNIPDGEPGGTATSGYYGYYSYSAAWGLYVEFFLLIIACIMAFMIASGKTIESPAAVPATETPGAPNVPAVPSSDVTGKAFDDLKKYKELLDEGILSQEEFDRKKKELLDL